MNWEETAYKYRKLAIYSGFSEARPLGAPVPSPFQNKNLWEDKNNKDGGQRVSSPAHVKKKKEAEGKFLLYKLSEETVSAAKYWENVCKRLSHYSGI